MSQYDVAILGAGPGGYETAIRCAQYGFSVALIEKDQLGGTCLNRGCIPTKALLHCALEYDAAVHADLGISYGSVAFQYDKMHAYKDKIVSRLRNGVSALEKAYGVDVIQGTGVLESEHEIRIGDRVISSKNIILATGSSPAKPPIPGIDSPFIMTSDEVLQSPTCPEEILIIGAGVIGIEFATLFSKLGKKVSIIEMMPDILPMLDPEIRSAAARVLTKEMGVTFHTNAAVRMFREVDNSTKIEVTYEHGGNMFVLRGDCCILAIGRKPCLEGLGLEKLGIKMDGKFIAVNEHMQTNIPNIYAIGDITGKLQLAHTATAQGMVCASHIHGKLKAIDYTQIPSCIYTNPEIAFIGLTEQQALDTGRNIKVGRFSTAGNGKSLIENCSSGLAKIIIDDDNGEILGAHVFAPRATDIIGEIAAVMQCEGTIEELQNTIHPHPTISEVWLEAAHDIHEGSCNAMPKTKIRKS